jgi:hypothetical protein
MKLKKYEKETFADTDSFSALLKESREKDEIKKIIFQCFDLKT